MAGPTPPDFLIPPRQKSLREGSFAWPKTIRWFSEVSSPSPLFEALGERVSEPAQAHLRFRIDNSLSGHDAYHLQITPSAVEIVGVSSAALFHGLQTLLAVRAGRGDSLPCCEIHDAADFKRRGVYLDCSRGKVPTLETLKQLIERLASWKINEIQLYIENVFEFKQYPAIGEGFDPYSVEDLQTLQSFCADRHIAFVGSLASLGHMETILALPAFTPLGELPDYRGYPGGTTLCATDPESLRLVKDLYEEFVPLFDTTDFNLCGDEPWELGKGRSRDAVEARGAGAVYADFISGLHNDLTQKYGKRVNMWGDVVFNHPESLDMIPSDTVMLNWEYDPDGPRFAFGETIRNHGFPMVICPGTNAWQSHGSRLPDALANVSGFAAVGRDQEAEGLLMTDWGDGGHRNPLGASLISLAHAAAHAWNGAGVDDDHFTALACKEVLGYEAPEQAAELVTALGNVSPTFPRALYLSLIHPMGSDEKAFADLNPRSPIRMMREAASTAVEKADAAELEQLLDTLKPEAYGDVIPGSAPSFEDLARCELALAARMDVLAARKILITKDLHAGRSPSASDCKTLADDMEDAANIFKSHWLLRNRSSRLEDNLLLWDHAVQELREAPARTLQGDVGNF